MTDQTRSSAALARLRARMLDDLLRPAMDEQHRADRLVNEVRIWMEQEAKGD